MEEGVLPFPLKIKWVRGSATTGVILSKEGEVIIRLGYNRDQNKNFIEALVAYLNVALLPNSRHCVSNQLLKAIELLMSIKMIEMKQPRAYNEFMFGHYRPAVDGDTDLKYKFDQLVSIDGNGLFERVLLRELSLMGAGLFGSAPIREIQSDVDGFVKFLEAIANREQDEKVQLNYKGKFIRVGITLVAKWETPIEVHYDIVIQNFQHGARSVYLSARSEKNIERTRELAIKLEAVTGIAVLGKSEFDARMKDGTRRPAIIYALGEGTEPVRVRNASPSEPPSQA